jgi:hypothetical protein
MKSGQQPSHSNQPYPVIQMKPVVDVIIDRQIGDIENPSESKENKSNSSKSQDPKFLSLEENVQSLNEPLLPKRSFEDKDENNNNDIEKQVTYEVSTELKSINLISEYSSRDYLDCFNNRNPFNFLKVFAFLAIGVLGASCIGLGAAEDNEKEYILGSSLLAIPLSISSYLLYQYCKNSHQTLTDANIPEESKEIIKNEAKVFNIDISQELLRDIPKKLREHYPNNQVKLGEKLLEVLDLVALFQGPEKHILQYVLPSQEIAQKLYKEKTRNREPENVKLGKKLLETLKLFGLFQQQPKKHILQYALPDQELAEMLSKKSKI